ncbi:unnamed protein product [Onchocerca ochengi]|uniref:Rit1_C domain-containing protein n=1 Tax=Onchocerca ochengi TaxID=42157 RepID=A0A182EYQ1_ONCOC|nr:unnamed protein product [Onchocerca ochengi]
MTIGKIKNNDYLSEDDEFENPPKLSPEEELLLEMDIEEDTSQNLTMDIEQQLWLSLYHYHRATFEYLRNETVSAHLLAYISKKLDIDLGVDSRDEYITSSAATNAPYVEM